MRKPKSYSIPGFSRYRVIRPFAIVDTRSGTTVRQYRHARGAPQVHLYDDTGKRRMLSVVTIATLAFHGQQPRGYVPYHRGGALTPASVCWIPDSEARRIRRSALTEQQRHKASELYFDEGWTQDRIGEKFGVSQGAISRAVNYRS